MDVVRHLTSCEISPIDGREARRRWDVYRQLNGYSPGRALLTPPSDNMKLAKAGKLGIAVTYGLALAPANSSGHNTCRFSTPLCRSGCIAFAGNGRFSGVQAARVLRTNWLLADPSGFLSLLVHEIDRAARKHGEALAVRLNTFSDIPWETVAPWIFEREVQFYDYTKRPNRTPPANYHLTFSASERTTDEEVTDLVRQGQNVAVIFTTTRNHLLPTHWKGVSVVDGDESDARHLDPRGVVVGLRAKGTLRTRDRALRMVRAA